ncbi:hypothetical protein [Marinifilum caeruleilacunae]|uniref:Lipoprotein n=1 Tax=Marinifilum caeruleilacunae TaxID=2499076 RepID=A0ABX1WRF2_9BACT|nr:hypothetical protein [Marinifilum caeruleilacunae]NOU58663.1 hypothetical protein [Marinifilum caeruleilacunae]
MKHSHILLVLSLLVAACNSYDHEAYIAKFKADFDKEINSYTVNKHDSARLLSARGQSIEEFKAEKIANDRFYIDNYSWYQLGKNLMLSPEEAKIEAKKYGFERPYYFLEFLKSETTKGPVKKQVMEDVRNRLYIKHGKDSVQIYGCAAKDLFAAVKRHEKYKYFFFLKVDFEKVKDATDKQKKVAAQMFQGAFKRLLAKTEVKDNLYHITISKGEEIGISEDLFIIGKGMLEDSNKDFIEMRKTQADYMMNLNPEQVRLVSMNWDNAYSLYKRYVKNKKH